jgi:hypothetical protein
MERERERQRSTPLAAGLLSIAAGLATAAVLGPLATGVIDYHVTETLLNQTIGLDAVSLFVVAPLAVLAAVLVLRGHVGGQVLALGIGAYTAYMFVQYVVGPDYTGLPGNNELLFPVYLVLFALGWLVTVVAWGALDLERLPSTPARDRLVGRFLLPLLAFFAFVRYVPALVDAMGSGLQDDGYLAGPSFFWTIALLDLGVFLPGTVAACVGLAQGTAWAHKALYTVVGWFALVGPAVAAMAITMYVNGDPNASGSGVVIMSILGLVFASLAVFVLRPLLGARSRSSSAASSRLDPSR